MIQGVSGASSISELYTKQQQNAVSSRPKPVQKIDKQDSVELSHQAKQAAQAGHKRGRG